MSNLNKKLKIVFSISLIIAIVVIALFLGLTLVMTLINRNAISNANLINALAILLGLFSLPGIVSQLVGMLVPEKKKSYHGTHICSNCKQTCDFVIKEE